MLGRGNKGKTQTHWVKITCVQWFNLILDGYIPSLSWWNPFCLDDVASFFWFNHHVLCILSTINLSVQSSWHDDWITSNIHKSTFFVFFTYQSVARGASLRKPHPGTKAIGNGCVPSAEDLLVAWRRVWPIRLSLGKRSEQLVGWYTIYIYIHILNEHIMIYIFIHL